MAASKNLVTAPIASTLLMFAIPTLASSMLQSANGSIATIFVGHLIGSDAVAATTNGNLVMFLMTAFVFGFGMAATILVGQSFGRGDLRAARRVVGTTLGSFVPVSLLLAVLGVIYAPSVLALLGTAPAIVPLSEDFLQVTFLGLPAILIMTMIMMTLRGAGDAITPLIFMAVSVVLNVALNPLLIAGFGPIAPMGIAGSALANAVANWISLIGMLGYVYYKRSPLRLRRHELGNLLPNPSVLRLVLTKGFPMGIQMIVVSGAMLAMMTLVNAQGVDTTAAFGATQQLWTYVQMPAMALGAAVSAMSAQNIGAGRWDRVGQVTRYGILYNLLLTGGLIGLLLLADRQALLLFLGAESPAVAIGQRIAILGTWGFLPFGVTMVLFATIRANGQVWGPLAILFLSMFPIRLGFAYGFAGLWGVDALWLSFPIGMLATMLMAIWLYLYGNWRGEADMAPPPALDAARATPKLREDATIGPASAALFTEAAPPGAPLASQAPPLRCAPPGQGLRPLQDYREDDAEV